MKRSCPDGLICAGGVTRSFLARMPALLSRIGPVKASSFRVARRIANSLRAGTAAHTYADLADCGLIWLAVPDEGIAPLAAEMAAFDGEFLKRAMMILCESGFDSSYLGLPRPTGVKIGSVNVVPGTHERIFVAEGEADVVAEIRKRFAVEKRKVIALQPGHKPFYLSGMHLGSSLILPWIAGAVESLRLAGFTRADATRLAESLGARALRSYRKAGSKAWSAAAGADMHAIVEHEFARMDGVDPRIAALFARGVETGITFFRSAPEVRPPARVSRRLAP